MDENERCTCGHQKMFHDEIGGEFLGICLECASCDYFVSAEDSAEWWGEHQASREEG